MSNENKTEMTLEQQQRARFAPQLLGRDNLDELMEDVEKLVDFVINGLPDKD